MLERHAAGGEPTLQQVPAGAARYTARAVARQRIRRRGLPLAENLLPPSARFGLGLDLGAARLDWV